PALILNQISASWGIPNDSVRAGNALEACARSGRRWIGGDHDAGAIASAYARMRGVLNADTAGDLRLFVRSEFASTTKPPRCYNTDLRRLIDNLFAGTQQRTFLQGSVVDMEENREHEFKEVRSQKPVNTIIETAQEYTVAFLNAGGRGRLWFGIQDDGNVSGVQLSRSDRDRLQRDLMNSLSQIQPSVSPGAFQLNLHPVIVDGEISGNVYVVELVVPEVRTQSLFFTANGSAYIKYEGGHKKLTGLHLQDEILRRFGL
ncbi:ATP-binding protein, partial [Magnetospirillum sulfuroxidans]